MIKKGLNVWSIPGGLDGTINPFRAIDIAAEYEFEAIELAVSDQGVLTPTTTEATCAEIRAYAAQAGVELLTLASGLYWSRAVADEDQAARDQAGGDLDSMLQIAAWIGAKTLLVIPGAVDVFFLPDRPAQSYEKVLSRASEALAKHVETAARCQVRIGLENVWNKFLLSPTEMASFIDSFNSQWIGSYLDVANILPYGYPEQWIKILRHRIVGVHFKDFRKAVGTGEGFVDLLEGDVNWPEVMTALAEIGYSGPVVAEMIPLYKHYPLVRVANASRAMDAILKRG